MRACPPLVEVVSRNVGREFKAFCFIPTFLLAKEFAKEERTLQEFAQFGTEQEVEL